MKSKVSVNYRVCERPGHECASCVHFLPAPPHDPTVDNRCELVQGAIEPLMTCNLYEPLGRSPILGPTAEQRAVATLEKIARKGRTRMKVEWR